MRRDIFINVSPFEKRIALCEDGRLSELVVDRPENQRIVGNIYKGRVVSVLPGLQAAFVDIGQEKAAFLHAADVAPVGHDDGHHDDEDEDGDGDPRQRGRSEKPIDQLLREGQEILVQVIKEPISTKGAKVTGYLSLAGRFLVCMPNTTFIGVSKKSRDHTSRRRLRKLVQDLRGSDVGYIVRTNGLTESEDEFRAEMNMLETKWAYIKSVATEVSSPSLVLAENEASVGILRDYFSEKVDKVVVDDKEEFKAIRAYIRELSPELVNRVHLYEEKVPLFDAFELENDVYKLYQDKVWIRKGSHLVIETTEAMTTIDVNTGRNVGKDDQAATILDTNITAAKEIAKQLRLRDLGGIIVCDFIDMDSEDDKEKLLREFKRALRTDRAPITLANNISQFGLVEMTRKRVREQLIKTVSEPCPYCEGRGQILQPGSIVANVERWIRRSQSRNGPKEITLVVHPRIIEFLMADRASGFHRLESFGANIELVEDPDAPADSFRIFHTRSLEELTPQHHGA